jgi:hypothetical protein
MCVILNECNLLTLLLELGAIMDQMNLLDEAVALRLAPKERLQLIERACRLSNANWMRHRLNFPHKMGKCFNLRP